MDENLFQAIKKDVELELKLKRHRLLMQQQAMAKQAQDINTYQKMQTIADDLFAAIGDRSYSGLADITSPMDIRIIDYVMTESSSVIYKFSIGKKNAEKIAVTLLEQDRANMMRDIARSQANLIAMNGYAVAQFIHPYLVTGLYVWLTDLGNAVIINVITRF